MSWGCGKMPIWLGSPHVLGSGPPPPAWGLLGSLCPGPACQGLSTANLLPHGALPCTAMVELDGDDVRISSRGKLAERDIVQVKLGNNAGAAGRPGQSRGHTSPSVCEAQCQQGWWPGGRARP